MDYGCLKGRVICVEGNIAAGKTTLLSGIESVLKGENVPIWAPEENVDPKLMEWFYEDSKKFQPIFQLSMMIGRLKILEEAKRRKKESDCVILLDTGIIREYVFSEANKNMGSFDERSFRRHVKTLENLMKDMGLDEGGDTVDCVLFLDSDEERCLSNAQIRKRKGETLDIDYLRELSSCYQKNIHRAGSGLVHLDCTQTFPDPKTVLETLVEKFL